MEEGSSFGELALLMSIPRAGTYFWCIIILTIATIKASRDTALATLNKEQFVHIIGKVQEAQINRKLEILDQI